MIVAPMPEIVSPEKSTLLPHLHMMIAGVDHASRSGRHGTVWNPAAGQPSAQVHFAGVAEVDFAVASAREIHDR